MQFFLHFYTLQADNGVFYFLCQQAKKEVDKTIYALVLIFYNFNATTMQSHRMPFISFLLRKQSFGGAYKHGRYVAVQIERSLDQLLPPKIIISSILAPQNQSAIG